MLMIFQYQMKICPNFHVSLPPSVIKEKVFFFIAGQVAWGHPCSHEQSSGPAALLVLHAFGLTGLGHNAKAESWNGGGAKSVSSSTSIICQRVPKEPAAQQGGSTHISMGEKA